MLHTSGVSEQSERLNLQDATGEKAAGQEQEIWKPIVGYEGVYSVSSFGNIRREFGAKGTRKGYILKPWEQRDGYSLVGLCMTGVERVHLVHLLTIRSFVGNCPKDYECNHKNGNKSDNRLSNLEYITHKENIEHALRNGLYPSRLGEKNSCAKLTNEQVLKIRSLYLGGELSHRKIAKIFGVSHAMIGIIIRRKKWNHI